jgi:hypothetical protein
LITVTDPALLENNNNKKKNRRGTAGHFEWGINVQNREKVWGRRRRER